MTNNLKTTLQGSAFALTLLSFMGCNNDDTTAVTSTTGTTTTVSSPATTIKPTVKASVAAATSVAATSTKGAMITLDGDTSKSYYLPLGIDVPTTNTSYYTLPTSGVITTGTVDTSGVKIKVGDNDAVTDANLIGKDLTLSSNIALPTGNYEVTLPSVTLGSGTGLAVDSFAIKGIQVAEDGTSNFITGTTASTYPQVGSAVANTSAGFTVDSSLAGKTATLDMTAGGKDYTQTVKVDSNGKVNFTFNTYTGTLGAVSNLTLTLPSL